MMLSTQKEMYEDTVSTYSLMLLEGARRLSQSVDSEHSSRVQMLSLVHWLMFLVTCSKIGYRLVPAEWCCGQQDQGGQLIYMHLEQILAFIQSLPQAGAAGNVLKKSFHWLVSWAVVEVSQAEFGRYEWLTLACSWSVLWGKACEPG